MRLLAWTFLLLCGGIGCGAELRAETSVRVVETWPPGENITLASNQTFYLRLAYATDVPVQIWAHPMFRGDAVDAGSNPSRTYSGSGETFAWFFFFEPGIEVDEVRISAGDGSRDRTEVTATWRGHVTSGAASSDMIEPAWAVRMSAEAKAAQDREFEESMNQPVSVGDALLFAGFMMLMLGLLVLGLGAPAWALWRWRAGWRLAAGVPAVIMGFVVLRIMLGTVADPTSHNLWPFEIVQAGLLNVVIMIALLIARKVAGASRKASGEA